MSIAGRVDLSFSGGSSRAFGYRHWKFEGDDFPRALFPMRLGLGSLYWLSDEAKVYQLVHDDGIQIQRADIDAL